MRRGTAVFSVASKRIGAAIKARRQSEGLSQAAVARRARIHAPMLSRIERDERSDPYFSTIAKVAAAIGLSLDQLAAEAGLPAVRRIRATSSAETARIDEDLTLVKRNLDRAQDCLTRAKSRLSK
jgi:transcriptional regulator with XRE-family HTH domain